MTAKNKIRLVILILGILIGSISLAYLIVGSLRPKIAGIYLETLPSASVWLNGRRSGETPYKTTIKPGDTIIKLIPETLGANLPGYETKVNLVAGVETVVRYDFGPDEETSAGDIISFEKNLKGETSLVAITLPDSATLVIDGRERAFTPFKTSSITPGEHTLKFSAEGYNDRIVNVKLHEGFKLTAIVKLSRGKVKTTPSITPTPAEKVEEVEILSSEMGYVRIRKAPTSTSDEIGRAETGKRYKLLDSEATAGWYRIEFFSEGTQTDSAGWVSSQYARRIGNILTPTPLTKRATPSATLVVTPTQIP